MLSAQAQFINSVAQSWPSTFGINALQMAISETNSYPAARTNQVTRGRRSPQVARLLCRCAGSQVGEHGEHAPVRLRIRTEPELEEDLLHMGLDGPLGHEEACRDRLV
jgi:hypothetical protein